MSIICKMSIRLIGTMQPVWHRECTILNAFFWKVGWQLRKRIINICCELPGPYLRLVANEEGSSCKRNTTRIVTPTWCSCQLHDFSTSLKMISVYEAETSDKHFKAFLHSINLDEQTKLYNYKPPHFHWSLSRFSFSRLSEIEIKKNRNHVEFK